MDRKVIVTLLCFGIVGLFFPWFYFEKSIDYTIGLDWIASMPTLSIGYVLSFIFIFIKSRSKVTDFITLMGLLAIPITCIYKFLTWHTLTITGKIDILVSLTTTHYGFYLTFLSSLFAAGLYILHFKKE
ncbi:hypothetical protein [Romboutsia sp.]|uniref:hypothetical protein n=1 Tax=Romboutsia sp. TaxID=1965302 RepID=UPI003F382716